MHEAILLRQIIPHPDPDLDDARLDRDQFRADQTHDALLNEILTHPIFKVRVLRFKLPLFSHLISSFAS